MFSDTVGQQVRRPEQDVAGSLWSYVNLSSLPADVNKRFKRRWRRRRHPHDRDVIIRLYGTRRSMSVQKKRDVYTRGTVSSGDSTATRTNAQSALVNPTYRLSPADFLVNQSTIMAEKIAVGPPFFSGFTVVNRRFSPYAVRVHTCDRYELWFIVRREGRGDSTREGRTRADAEIAMCSNLFVRRCRKFRPISRREKELRDLQ